MIKLTAGMKNIIEKDYKSFLQDNDIDGLAKFVADRNDIINVSDYTMAFLWILENSHKAASSLHELCPFLICNVTTNILDITIPSSITKVDHRAFRHINSQNTTINFQEPSFISSIPKQAFYCVKGLKEIILPNSITQIFDEAFIECPDLEKIFVPEGVTRLSKDMFVGCNNNLIITTPSRQGLPRNRQLFIRESNIDWAKEHIKFI